MITATDIDISNPKTDVVELYFKFKELFWPTCVRHKLHFNTFTIIELEVFVEGTKGQALKEEDFINLRSLISVWLEIGLIKINNGSDFKCFYECVH